MNKSKLTKFIEKQTKICNDFIEFDKRNDDRNSRMFWTGRWGILCELMHMIEGGDFDDNDSN